MNIIQSIYNYLDSILVPRDTYYSLITLALYEERLDILKELSDTYDSKFAFRACQIAIDLGKLHLIDAFIDKLTDEQLELLHEEIV